MTSNADATSLRPEELVALVQQLRQQLAERDRQIADLKRQLAEQRTTLASKVPNPPLEEVSPVEREGPIPGSQEDLLTQLEQLYPGGKSPK
jgi:hypothetical protein